MGKIDRLARNIISAEDLSAFVKTVSISCTFNLEFPDGREINAMEMLFPRYSLRMLYHAKRLAHMLLSLRERLLTKADTDRRTIAHVNPAIYFEFDAFLYSAKSLFEKSVIVKGKKFFSNQRAKRFEKICNDAYNEFVGGELAPLRDEAVHLNMLGTSTSSVAYARRRNGRFHLYLPTSIMKNQKPVNLINLFADLARLSIATLEKVSVLLIGELVSRFGLPTDLLPEYRIRRSIFRISQMATDDMN